MKPGSQAAPAAMYPNDKRIIMRLPEVSAFHRFGGEGLDYLRLCAPPYIKKLGCSLSCNHVSAFMAGMRPSEDIHSLRLQ
jgi:hypothetical protein